MRHTNIWFRSARNAWYVEIDGRQIRLAVGRENEDAALKAYHKLMAGDPSAIPKSSDITTAQVCDYYLVHAERERPEKVFSNAKYYLQSFCDRNARTRVADLKPFHATRWLDAHPSWKASRRHALLYLKRAFLWAEREGLLAASPFRTMKPVPARRRTRILSDAEVREILAVITDDCFRNFVDALLQTGCRPGEVSRVTARDVNLAMGTWVLHEHKTAKQTGKPRVVYLNPSMVEKTRAMMAKHPEGPLFPNSRGKAFNKNSIRCRFMRLRESLPHIPHFVCYNLRHTYATQALVNGVGVAQVAELLGHSSTEMVMLHYGHLAQQVTHMREMAQKAVTPSGG